MVLSGTSLIILERRALAVRRDLDRKTGELRAKERQVVTLTTQIDTLKTDITTYDKAIAVLNTISEDRQNKSQEQIELLVTRGLQSIFGDNMSFHLIRGSGKRPEIHFVLRTSYSDGRVVETDVMSANGGGLAAVVGFLLRVVVILLDDRNSDNMLKLDEIFAHLSAVYREPMAMFIKELVYRTDLRVLMVTHHEEFGFIADKLYSFKLVDGITKVKEMKPSDI